MEIWNKSTTDYSIAVVFNLMLCIGKQLSIIEDRAAPSSS
jgi:hypothetical protein